MNIYMYHATPVF